MSRDRRDARGGRGGRSDVSGAAGAGSVTARASGGTILFEPLARNWLQLNVRSLEAATYRGYKGLLDRVLLPTMRAWPVTDEAMSRKRLHDFLGKDLHAKGVSLSTRVAALRCLSALFAWALVFGDVKHLTFNPALQLGKHLRQPGEQRHKKAPPNPMTREQAAALLAWVKDQRRAFWEWFLFLLETGARQGEASALKWEHLDLDIGKAHIVEAFSGSQRWLERQDGDEDGDGEKDTKTHRTDQWIDLSPRLVVALRELQAEQRKEAFRCGRKMPQHVFVNSRGRAAAPGRRHARGVPRGLHGAEASRPGRACVHAALPARHLRDGAPDGEEGRRLGRDDAGARQRGNDAALLLQVGAAGGGQPARERGR